MPFHQSSASSDGVGENLARPCAMEKTRTDIAGCLLNLREPAACMPTWYRSAYHF